MSHLPPLVEPFAAPDTFVSGVCPVEDMGDNIHRLTFFVNQRSAYEGAPERAVVARIVLTPAVLKALLIAASGALDAAPSLMHMETIGARN